MRHALILTLLTLLFVVTIQTARTTWELDPNRLAGMTTASVAEALPRLPREALEPAWRGDPDGVPVVFFARYDTDAARRAYTELTHLLDQVEGVRLLVRHLPDCDAPRSCLAAEAAICAQAQGADVAWTFHELAFKNQHHLNPDALRRHARAAGARPVAFEACLSSGAARKRLEADRHAAQAHGVDQAPAVRLGTQRFGPGVTARELAQALARQRGATLDHAAQQAAALFERPTRPQPVPKTPTRTLTYGEPFVIDAFEASLRRGVAVSARGTVPALGVTWYEARDACEAAGKRLCTEAEWVSACQGATAIDDDEDGEFADDAIEGTTWPYGDRHDPRRCWDGKPAHFRPLYTGEQPGCVSVDGVYDLTGNVEEWVGESPDRAVLLGGAWDTPRDHARCHRRNDTYGPGYASPRTGFRCCSDP